MPAWGRIALCPRRRELHGADRSAISLREVERLTEERGGTLEACQEGPDCQLPVGRQGSNWAAYPDTSGVWAVALDAAKARFNDGWHEVKAGVVFWAEPRWDGSGMAGGKAAAQSYVAETGPMEEAGARLYREAVRRPGGGPGGVPGGWSASQLEPVWAALPQPGGSAGMVSRRGTSVGWSQG